MAIVTALFFGVMCLFMATGFLAQLPVDLGATTLLERYTKASYIADAAVVDTMAYISFELSEGRNPCPGGSYLNSGSLGDWSWECSVVPDDGTPPNGLSSLRIYRLTATAFLDGEEAYRVVADVQGGQSFARFNMFIENDSTPPIFDYAVGVHSVIKGPVHKNSHIKFRISQDAKDDGDPNFDSLITSTADQHLWNGTEPTNDTEYKNVFFNGRADLEYGVAPRPMPDSSDPLAAAAWGGSLPGTLSPGVTVNAAGGIYVQDTVQRLHLSAVGEECHLEIQQAGVTTLVVEDHAANERRVQVGEGAITTVPGVGTGVVFVQGDIESLQGRNRGPRTIANDFEASGRFIEITGALLRADTPGGTEPTGLRDRIGVVTRTVKIADHNVLPRVNSPSGVLYLYGSFLATDTFTVEGWLGGGNPGRMAIFGGVQSGFSWEVCSFSNNTTFPVTSGYGGREGFGTPDIVYDKLLPNEPPPEYPTTAAAELQIRSWTEHRL